MKNVKLLLGLFMITCTAAWAQPGPPKLTTEDVTKRVEQNAERLNLSEEQKKSYLEISLKYFEQGQALREEGKKDREARMEQAQSIRAEQDKEMLELLDKYQYAEYKKIQEERKSNMKRRRRN